MPSSTAPQATAFGYLSTWDSPEHGCLGGYLIISALGRPLEFHCTAPVRTSRAQQILFGPTLWPYVLGEQIGGTLLGEAKLRASIIITDHPAPLCLRAKSGVPMVQLKRTGATAAEQYVEQLAVSEPSNEIVLANAIFELAPGCESDRDVTRELLTLLSQTVDLDEPFERIREAIREAHRLGEQDVHVQAA